MQEHFQILSRFNAWANHRLYTVAGRLSSEAQSKQRPAAYFGSLIGTLNHILVADRIWLDRIEHRGKEPPHQLDDLPYPQMAALHEMRKEEDRRIMTLVDRLRPQDYETILVYRNMRGEACRTPMPQVLTHFFNHQTHHRGQAHALVKEAGENPPSLDLIEFLR